MKVLAKNKNAHGLNKVQSDFRLWDLQINPGWVSWGPGSGINCYISWPSSCCLSQPAWLGPGLARNHGLQTQQYGHFPQRRNTGLGGLLSKQDEPCQTLLAPTFHSHFLYRHFPLFALAYPWSSERLPNTSGSSVTRTRRKTEHRSMLRFSVRKTGEAFKFPGWLLSQVTTSEASYKVWESILVEMKSRWIQLYLSII